MKRKDGDASRTHLESQAVDRVEIPEGRGGSLNRNRPEKVDGESDVGKKKVGVREWEREEEFIDVGGGQGRSRSACAISLHNQIFPSPKRRQ